MEYERYLMNEIGNHGALAECHLKRTKALMEELKRVFPQSLLGKCVDDVQQAIDCITKDEIEKFKCKMCEDKGWIAGPGDSHPCPNCKLPNVHPESVASDGA